MEVDNFGRLYFITCLRTASKQNMKSIFSILTIIWYRHRSRTHSLAPNSIAMNSSADQMVSFVQRFSSFGFCFLGDGPLSIGSPEGTSGSLILLASSPLASDSGTFSAGPFSADSPPSTSSQPSSPSGSVEGKKRL